MINKGYIALHRKIIDWEFFPDDLIFKVFIYLLLNANYKDKRERGKIVKRGQLVISIRKLAERLDKSINTIQRALIELENDKSIIRQQISNIGTLITIVKYSEYQMITKNTISNIDTEIDTVIDTVTDTMTDTDTDTATDTDTLFNKDNNNNNTSSSSTREGEKIDFSQKIKAEENWCEMAQMQMHISREELTAYVDEFARHLALTDNTPRDMTDYRRHLLSWLRIQIEQKAKKTSKTLKYGTDRTDNSSRKIGSDNPADYTAL